MEAAISRPKVKIYADGAVLEEMQAQAKTGLVQGFTTNPSLMRKAGVKEYLPYAKQLAAALKDFPLSLEVLADSLPEMERQANLLRPLGDNVYVKIPVTTSNGESTGPLIKKLSDQGTRLNITALMHTSQVVALLSFVNPKSPTVWSLFAGRIADVGRDPMPMMHACRALVSAGSDKWELLWASCREVWNVYQADESGCDIITAPGDVIKKMKDIGKPSLEVSLEAVKIFVADAKASGLSF